MTDNKPDKPVDKEFEVNQEDDLDDEHTLEEEERLGGVDPASELADLQGDAEMSVEELLKQYMGGDEDADVIGQYGQSDGEDDDDDDDDDDEEDADDDDETLKAVIELYSKVDGYAISKGEVAKRKADGDYSHTSLTYGEVDLEDFTRILTSTIDDDESGLVFYDVGSGTGKAVMAAALTCSFTECHGIELLTPLHDSAKKILSKAQVDSLVPEGVKIKFHNDDLFNNQNWTSADVVFITTTSFGPEDMGRIEEICNGLKPGAFLITTTKEIESPHLRVMKKDQLKLAKGAVSVFVHRMGRGGGGGGKRSGDASEGKKKKVKST